MNISFEEMGMLEDILQLTAIEASENKDMAKHDAGLKVAGIFNIEIEGVDDNEASEEHR